MSLDVQYVWPGVLLDVQDKRISDGKRLRGIRRHLKVVYEVALRRWRGRLSVLVRWLLCCLLMRMAPLDHGSLSGVSVPSHVFNFLRVCEECGCMDVCVSDINRNVSSRLNRMLCPWQTGDLCRVRSRLSTSDSWDRLLLLYTNVYVCLYKCRHCWLGACNLISGWKDLKRSCEPVSSQTASLDWQY